MPNTTREFSICLLPDPVVSSKVMQLRAELPASPYRDDTPHVTLLRGIVSPTEASDDELLHALSTLLKPYANLPTTFRVKKVANRSSHLYSATGLIVLQASEQLKAYRKEVVRTLKQHGYTIPVLDQTIYMPHLTIRLGVPLKGAAKKTVSQLFLPQTDITCSSWMVLRLQTADTARTMHEISPKN